MNDIQINKSPVCVLTRHILSMLGWRLFAFILVIILWTCLSLLTNDNLPSPLKSFNELKELLVQNKISETIKPEPSIWNHVVATAIRSYLGLIVSFMVFFPIGVIIGSRIAVYKSVIGLIEFARAVPAFMLLLILLNLDIVGEWGRVICICFAPGLLMADYTATSVKNLPPERIEILKLMGASHIKALRKAGGIPIILNAVLPALRVGVGIAVILSIVVEMITIPNCGLGVFMNTALGRVNIAASLAFLVLAGLIGWIGNLFVTLISDVCWWYWGGRPLF